MGLALGMARRFDLDSSVVNIKPVRHPRLDRAEYLVVSHSCGQNDVRAESVHPGGQAPDMKIVN